MLCPPFRHLGRVVWYPCEAGTRFFHAGTNLSTEQPDTEPGQVKSRNTLVLQALASFSY